MRNLSINLILDKRRPRKDNTFTIIFKIIYNRTNTIISTNYSVGISDWDERHKKIKKSCKKYDNTTIINHEIHLMAAKFNSKLMMVTENDKFNTATEIKKFLTEEHKDLKSLKKPAKITFKKFTEQLIEEFRFQGRIGNARAYSAAQHFLANYFRADFPFKALTPKVLKRIENRFIAKGYSYNGLSVNLRTVRAIYNKAIAANIIDQSIYPFKRHSYETDKYHIREEKTKKRAISKEVLNLIEQFEAEENSGMFHAKNYFLFSFYCRGINIRDMAMLKRANIENNVLHYRRAKTKYTYDISLTQKAKAILNLYGYEEKKHNEFLFPMVTRPDNPELLEKDLYNAMRNTNKNLQKLAKELGLDVHLTTYVARHSWATIADKLGVDRRTISQGLGHTSLSTTEIYINDIVSSEDLSKADDLITG